MLPNVNGWSWSAGHVIFISVFLFVALTVAGTVVIASWRSRRTLMTGGAAAVQWEEDFHDLPEQSRTCRHELTGEFAHRTCDRAFDCRGCMTHPKLRQYAEDGQRLYHRGHTWLERSTDGTFLIGLDEFATCLIGAGASVHMPAVGTVLHENTPAIRVRRGEHDVRIVAPLDGEVVAVSGKTLRLRPTQSEVRLTHLLRGPEVEAWMSRELTRMQLMIGPALADGGVPVQDMPAAMPNADWSGIWGRVFLEP